MFAPWLKRNALKRKTTKRGLMVSRQTAPSLILLISMMGFFVAVGLFVLQQTYAAGTIFGR